MDELNRILKQSPKTHAPVAQNLELYRNYQHLFGKAISVEYFTIRFTHHMEGSWFDEEGKKFPMDCDRCNKIKTSGEIARFYVRDNSSVSGCHAYDHVLNHCFDCIGPNTMVYKTQTIHAIHKKLHYDLID